MLLLALESRCWLRRQSESTLGPCNTHAFSENFSSNPLTKMELSNFYTAE
jgi:hypothetical protein